MKKFLLVLVVAVCSFAQTKDAGPRKIANGPTDPATCSVGELFVNTSSTPALKLATATSPCVWSVQQADPTDKSMFWLKDDFPSMRPDASPCCELAWYVQAGTSIGVAQSTVGVGGHPGVKGMQTGAVSGNLAQFSLAYGGGGDDFYNLNSGTFSRWSMTNTVLIDKAAGVAPLSNVGYWFGLVGSATTCNGGGSWCIAADTTAPVTCVVGTNNGVTSVAWNPSNWMYIQNNAVNTTCLDSGVPALSGTWYTLAVSYETATTTVTYTVNGAASRTISSGQSLTAKVPLLSGITRTSSAKIVWEDYWSFIGYGLTR